MKEIIKFNYDEFGVAKTKAKEIEDAFTPMVVAMDELQAEYDVFMMLNDDVDALTPDICKEAGELRRKYVKIRTSTSKAHKETKSDFLKAGRYIDSLKNKQAEVSAVAESSLDALENHFKILEKKRLAELQAIRYGEIKGFLLPGTLVADYSLMSDSIWETFLIGTKAGYKEWKEAPQQDNNPEEWKNEKGTQSSDDLYRIELIRGDKVETVEGRVRFISNYYEIFIEE